MHSRGSPRADAALCASPPLSDPPHLISAARGEKRRKGNDKRKGGWRVFGDGLGEANISKRGFLRRHGNKDTCDGEANGKH